MHGQNYIKFWLLTLSEEHRPRVFENRTPRYIRTWPYVEGLRAGQSGDLIAVRANFPYQSRLALGGPPSLLFIECRVVSGGKTAGAWRWPPTPT